MGLSRIVYLSRAVNPLAYAELSTLVERCRVKNEAAGISGLLLHSAGNFIQVLEGEEIVITSLYAKIISDDRHSDLRMLFHRPAASRLFPEWGMQLASTTRMAQLDMDAVDRTLRRLRLAPDAASVEADALQLLQEFRRQLMSAA